MKPILSLIIMTLLLTACNDQKTSEEKIIRPVKYMIIKQNNQSIKQQFPGVLQANQRVNLSFQVSGKLIKLPIKEGLKVKKGQMIGQLDSRAYQAKYDSALAAYKNAKANYLRGIKLIKKEYISQADVDKLKASMDQSNAQLRLTQKALEETKLYAPFSGTIAKQYVRNYTDIQAKQEIISLQNNHHLEIVVNVPESVMLNTKRSQDQQEISLKAQFSTIPNTLFDLKINEYSTEADASTRTYKVTLSILDSKGYDLYPGMTVTVLAIINPKHLVKNPVYLIPENAVISDPNGKKGFFVWKIDQHHQVHLSPVKIGQLTDSRIQILQGLSPSDQIVTAGVHYLTENQPVKILKEFEVK